MQPFEVPEAIKAITDTYPSAETIINAANRGSATGLESIARLWLSEGIPFAFREMPGLYEALRDWMAKRLEIHAKEITLIGSGRQGSSIAPPKTGKIFNEDSDLDWAAISVPLFQRCAEEFWSWYDDCKNGHAHPRNPNEKRYWDENLLACPGNIKRRFIDPYKIPIWDRYPMSRLISNTMWMLKCKCETTTGAPKFRKSSIRIYRDWEAFIRQLSTNLRYAAQNYINNV